MSKETKNLNVWVCPNCKGNPQFEHAKMMAHIKDVHGVDPKTTKGERRLLMHADASDHFINDYEWTIDGKKYLQHVCQKRAPMDAAMWGDGE